MRSGRAGGARTSSRTSRHPALAAAEGAAADAAALLREGREEVGAIIRSPTPRRRRRCLSRRLGAAANASPAMPAVSVVPSAGSISRNEPVRRESAYASSAQRLGGAHDDPADVVGHQLPGGRVLGEVVQGEPRRDVLDDRLHRAGGVLEQHPLAHARAAGRPRGRRSPRRPAWWRARPSLGAIRSPREMSMSSASRSVTDCGAQAMSTLSPSASIPVDRGGAARTAAR